MFRLPTQPFHRLLQHAAMPHFDQLGADPHLHPCADQPRRHRVGVLLDLDRAPLAHTHLLSLQRLQTPRRQAPQPRLLLLKLGRPRHIPPRHQGAHELHVLLAAAEVATATQPQRLVERVLEAPMPLLAIPVLVAAVRIGGLGRHAIMIRQRLVLRRITLWVAVVMDRQRHAVGAVTLGHSSQCPQRVLKPLAQTRKALREAQRHVLPVRVRQNKVIQQMRKRLPADGHAQLVHVREIG